MCAFSTTTTINIEKRGEGGSAFQGAMFQDRQHLGKTIMICQINHDERFSHRLRALLMKYSKAIFVSTNILPNLYARGFMIAVRILGDTEYTTHTFHHCVAARNTAGIRKVHMISAMHYQTLYEDIETYFQWAPDNSIEMQCLDSFVHIVKSSCGMDISACSCSMADGIGVVFGSFPNHQVFRN